ncbi:PREDICTED: SET and MYND domain-containing protein 4-like isoform X1 [Polistes dominula]|uniref:SET and MYND domain-containing protein 4-like isoform X1 n=1 Tax=Polistes dominula TaxID=743375 RepID=A0ABM1IBF4_POLDO|nr:PREDICTED: SET and MYND domain-containing protein 4-like isoform X1 [Polistes dominula]
MDLAKELILNLKQKNVSHVGYGLQKECEALVGHILQNMVKSQLPSLNVDRKNKKDSVKYREEGNQHFVMGDDIEAIESYTKSLAYANDKELMAYAYANRSAALFRKEMYKECLIDIDAALLCGYPENKRKKLKERGDRAIDELKKTLQITVDKDSNVEEIINQICLIQNAKEDITKTETNDIKHVNDKKNGKDLLLDNQNREKRFFNVSHLPIECITKKPRYLEKEGPLLLTHGQNKECPAASNGIEIVFSEEFGRHFRATKKFGPGDIITIEKPYAHVIYEERFYTHCHQCLSRCYNLIPCPNCPIAQYCSEECKKTAWDMAHMTECPILALLQSLLNVDKDKIKMIIKIVRLLIVVTENGSKIKELQEDMKIAESNPDSRTAGFTDEGVLSSFSARSALSLATNMTTRPLIGISAFACISALTSILLAIRTNFFGKKYEIDYLEDISELSDLKFCGSIMFRACVIMSSNCFSVQQEPGIKSGSGLYVTHSLYNHSCNPNTLRHFEELTMITRALQPILPGDQVFTSYGPAYAYMSRAERKEKIMQDYFFDCQCSACIFNWPTYNEILSNHVGSITKKKQLVEKLKPFKQRLLKNMYDIDAVKNVLNILYNEVSQPCEEIIHAEQYLRSYYLGKFK